MPELPEVETIKNEITPYLIGRTITRVEVFWEKLVREPSEAEFQARLAGQKIVGLLRYGKYLVLKLNDGGRLIMHLKMSGSLLVSQGSSPPPKYTRAILHLDGNTTVFFRDPRKFGRMWLVKDEAEVVGKLGPEPLKPDFTPEVLAGRLAGRKGPIKALLIDQGIIAGIGNLYADESLFAARIHPLRSGDSLSKEEVSRLYDAINKVLIAAIGNKGASIVNYYRPTGETGTAHFEFSVAHQRGKSCPRCGTPVKRIVVRNRGTYFCPKCQA